MPGAVDRRDGRRREDAHACPARLGGIRDLERPPVGVTHGVFRDEHPIVGIRRLGTDHREGDPARAHRGQDLFDEPGTDRTVADQDDTLRHRELGSHPLDPLPGNG